MSAIGQVVDRPTAISATEMIRLPPNSTRRVPKRAMTRRTVRLDTRPVALATMRRIPTARVLMPMSVRSSGRRGMNDAKNAPFTANWTATATVARRSAGDQVRASWCSRVDTDHLHVIA